MPFALALETLGLSRKLEPDDSNIPVADGETLGLAVGLQEELVTGQDFHLFAVINTERPGLLLREGGFLAGQ